jgi:Family of unknown function (DUF6516)
MKEEEQLYTLEFLLGFDGHVHWLDQGYRLKFEIKRVKPTKERPHGLRYSFTLHDPDGQRLMGFDNAHGVVPKGSRYLKRRPATDHWHRTEDDAGRPYSFTTADALLEDFFREATRILAERGINGDVVSVESKKRSDHD